MIYDFPYPGKSVRGTPPAHAGEWGRCPFVRFANPRARLIFTSEGANMTLAGVDHSAARASGYVWGVIAAKPPSRTV